MHIVYPKIHRLGKEETDGILEYQLCIQEKIDGANTSIWLEDGELKLGSRKRILGDEEFNGFVKYAKEHEGIKKLFEVHPDYRLFGEWLVRHTISYREDVYRKFYLFDIMVDGKFLPQLEVHDIANKFLIPTPKIFCMSEKLTEEQIKEFVGKSDLGENGEGVVIKSTEFVNKFGDPTYAKLVTQTFKEGNAIMFGGNDKHSESYNEMYVINKWATLARLTKIMNKIQPEVNVRLDKEHTPRIAMSCYHDLLTEEIWEIQKRVPEVNFKRLKNLCMRKFVKMYHDLLEGHISVAYERDQSEKTDNA